MPRRAGRGTILFRGFPTPVRIETSARRFGPNLVRQEADGLVILRGRSSPTPPARSLENWLRRQARRDIARHLGPVAARLKQAPNKVFVMGQRTKWGNCSALRNLSFNWR